MEENKYEKVLSQVGLFFVDTERRTFQSNLTTDPDESFGPQLTRFQSARFNPSLYKLEIKRIIVLRSLIIKRIQNLFYKNNNLSVMP